MASIRLIHDTAFAATPLFIEPLVDLLDEWQAGELRAYYYETIKATLEAFTLQMERERLRLDPSDN